MSFINIDNHIKNMALVEKYCQRNFFNDLSDFNKTGKKTIANLVDEAKKENLSFKIFKEYLLDKPSKEQFDSFLKIKSSKSDIKVDEYLFLDTIKKDMNDLIKFYKAQDSYDITCWFNTEVWKDKVYSSLHFDYPDVIHFNFFGNVEWTLATIDPISGKSKKEKIILNPGDVIYVKSRIKHQTITLSERLGYVFMPFTPDLYIKDPNSYAPRIKFVNKNDGG